MIDLLGDAVWYSASTSTTTILILVSEGSASLDSMYVFQSHCYHEVLCAFITPVVNVKSLYITISVCYSPCTIYSIISFAHADVERLLLCT